MRRNDISAWAHCIYELIYPGVLGSMIYDMAQIPELGNRITWFDATKVLVAGLFVLDYLHMMNDLKPLESPTVLSIFLDALISFGFCTVYWWTTPQTVLRMLVGSAVLIVVMFIYPISKKVDKLLFLADKGWTLLVTIGALIFAFVCRPGGGGVIFFSVLVILLAYGFQVFVLTEDAKTPKK